jgi:hypothetical protein
MPAQPPTPPKALRLRALLALFYALPVLFILGVCGYLAYSRLAHKPPPPRTISAAPFATVKIGGLAAAFYTGGNALRAAGNDLFIQFRDPQGQLADVGQVSFALSLNMPGTVMHSMGKVFPTATPGQYRTTLQPAMAGMWTATLDFSGPRGQAATNFPLNVMR